MNTTPVIGAPWPGIDGFYAGVSCGEDGEPDAHLVRLSAWPADKLNWADATAWAPSIRSDARLPTRFEGALLYANLHGMHEDTGDWYWTCSEHSAEGAWSQSFFHGSQNVYDKGFEAWAFAVVRIPLQGA